jgi:hypothetical protein
MVWSVDRDIPVAAALSHRDETYTGGEGLRSDSIEYKGNHAFIAHARSDIPALLATLDATRAELEEAREVLRGLLENPADIDGSNRHRARAVLERKPR